MELPYHHITVEILYLNGKPAPFSSMRLETRRQDERGGEIISPLGQRTYDSTLKHYSFQYKLKNPDARLWLTVIDNDLQTAQLITPGSHRNKFRVEPQEAGAGQNRGLTERPKKKAAEREVKIVYNIDNVENLNMAPKYSQRGSGTIIGENAKVTASLNKNSQVSIGAEADNALKKALDVAKKGKNDAARKGIQSLKREAKKKSKDKSIMQGIWKGVVKVMPSMTKELGGTAVKAITGLFS